MAQFFSIFLLYNKCLSKNLKNRVCHWWSRENFEKKNIKEIKSGEYAIIIINFVKPGVCWVKSRNINFVYDKCRIPYDETIRRAFFQKYIENPFLGSFVPCNDNLVAAGYIKDINV